MCYKYCYNTLTRHTKVGCMAILCSNRTVSEPVVLDVVEFNPIDLVA